MSKVNAAGIIVSGRLNPNWRGGPIEKQCAICSRTFFVKPSYKSAKFCSKKCVAINQKGKIRNTESTKVIKHCEVCNNSFSVFKSHVHRQKCCSKLCSFKNRSNKTKGENNPSWSGGLSRVPYTFDWLSISKKNSH